MFVTVEETKQLQLWLTEGQKAAVPPFLGWNQTGLELSGLIKFADLGNVALSRVNGLRLVHCQAQGLRASLKVLHTFSTKWCDLSHSDFGFATLRSAGFADSNLDFADFSGANLIDASFINCSLYRAKFDDANLDGVTFNRSNLWGASFHGTRLNWQDHAVIAELLRRELGELCEVFQLKGAVGDITLSMGAFTMLKTFSADFQRKAAGVLVAWASEHTRTDVLGWMLDNIDGESRTYIESLLTVRQAENEAEIPF